MVSPLKVTPDGWKKGRHLQVTWCEVQALQGLQQGDKVRRKDGKTFTVDDWILPAGESATIHNKYFDMGLIVTNAAGKTLFEFLEQSDFERSDEEVVVPPSARPAVLGSAPTSTNPYTRARQVRFDFHGGSVHYVVPYSEIYGMHPRKFVFGLRSIMEDMSIYPEIYREVMKVGDKVRSKDSSKELIGGLTFKCSGGRHRPRGNKKSSWKVRVGEFATIVAFDGDGDVKLKNAAGQVYYGFHVKSAVVLADEVVPYFYR